MYSPFSLQIIPMERLFLINFEKDPDEIYMGFEPQWFDDASYGTGLRIIAWRVDGYVDVYQQPDLKKEETMDVAAKGLGDTVICPLTDSRFLVTKTGVDVAFAFEDKAGRKVEVEVLEKNKKPTNPFSLLAPVGSSSKKPSFLPLYLMFQFDFVRRAHTDVRICINGRNHKADTFPFPLNGSRIYFMRYSADPFLVDWCPKQSRTLKPLSGKEKERYGPNEMVYELVEPSEQPAFARISANNQRHNFEAEFDPPFPEITHIAKDSTLGGEFVLGAAESVGVVRGTYEVCRKGDQVEVTLQPDGGWQPCPDKLFLKFLFRVAKTFRQWPKTYRWTAKIKLSADAPPYMESGWERV